MQRLMGSSNSSQEDSRIKLSEETRDESGTLVLQVSLMAVKSNLLNCCRKKQLTSV